MLASLGYVVRDNQARIIITNGKEIGEFLIPVSESLVVLGALITI